MIFVTDRIAGAKYNISDLNRVESNTQEIADNLEAVGYILNLGTVKTDWLTTDFFKDSDDPRYLGNIQILIDTIRSEAPSLPINMVQLDYVDANNIEKNLESVNDIFNNIVKEFKYSGETFAGEDISLV